MLTSLASEARPAAHAIFDVQCVPAHARHPPLTSDLKCVPSFNVRFRRFKDASAADAGYHGKGRLKFDQDQAWVDMPRQGRKRPCLFELKPALIPGT
jgi:hypothetical protein